MKPSRFATQFTHSGLRPAWVKCCLWLAFVVCTAFAQTTANVQGVVVDEQGATLPNATVTLLNQTKTLERQVVTNEDGSFAFQLLPPARYRLRVQCEGFRPVETTLAVLEARAVRILLRVGAVGAELTVSAPAATLNAASNSLTLDQQTIARLPLNGGNLLALATLAPGVVLTKASAAEQGQLSINGQRANANYFTVDGVSANVGVTASFSLGQAGAGALPGLSATGATNSLAALDGVQEFKVQPLSFAAEFGRTPGGQIALTTRAGTAQFNGAVSDYIRHEALDANDWFANRNGFGKAALRQHLFGASFGGPLPRSMYFFATYEGLRLRQPLFGSVIVPDLDARQTPAATQRALLQAFPLPNGALLGNGMAEFATTYTDPTALDAFSLRLDHTRGARQTLFARYQQSASQLRQRTGGLSELSTTQFNFRTLTLGLTQSLAANATNDLRLNASFATGAGRNELDGFGGARPVTAQQLFPNLPASAANSRLQFFILGLPALTLGKTVANTQRQFNAVEHFALERGAHQFKAGADLRWLAPVNDPAAYDQAVNFTGVSGPLGFPAPGGTVLSGRASSIQIAARAAVALRFTNVSAFAQDTWRISPRFSLSSGLRWEFNPPPASHGQLFTVTNLDDPANLQLTPARLWAARFDSFAPRVGFAWQLLGKSGWDATLRGGVGRFYDLGFGTAAANAASFPHYRQRSLFALEGVAWPLTATPAAPPAFTLEPPYGSFDVFDPRLAAPRTTQWQLAWQQTLAGSHTLSLAYTGAAGRQLLRREAWHNFNPRFGAPLYVTRNTAESDYHALQAQWQRRLARGWQGLAAYTWSHALDFASNDSAAFTPAARLAPRTDRGASDFDIRHAWTGALTYEPTRHWSFGLISRAHTARPLDVTYARDIGFGFYSLRPDLTPGLPLWVRDADAPGGKRLAALNAIGSPFTRPPDNRQGTLPRNAVRGFPFWQIDLALRREFTLAERRALQLRAEVYNALNHPNFADPRGALNDPLFGVSGALLNRGLGTAGVNGGLNPLYQVGGSRSIQLAIKLTF